MQEDLRKIRENVAGVDIGSEKIFIATEGEVKNFSTFTASYREAIKYLKEKGITSIVMESTGVYWITFHEMLEEAGFEVAVVNGWYTKNLPGRKSDMQDCQWSRQLHMYGLLKSSFIPNSEIKKLRSYKRLREDHIRMGSEHILHIQKALELMNVKLHKVISHITGLSGLRILKAILRGERNPKELVKQCEDQIRKKKEKEVLLSLEGNYREEHLFLLKQAVECWEFYQKKIEECDKEIEELLNRMTKDKTDIETKGKPKRTNSPNKMEIKDFHSLLMKLTEGKDPSAVVGLNDDSLFKGISEFGVDLGSIWESPKHFTSWLRLSPKKHESGKKNKKKQLKGSPQGSQIFRLAAQGVAKSKNTALGGFYHRIKAKHGSYVANKATARKLAVIFYNIMTKGYDYVETGLQKYQEQFEERKLKSITKQALKLGYSLIPYGV